MRFRDYFCIAMVALSVVGISHHTRRNIESAVFRSLDIQRDDANRELSVVLSTDQWTEFQIQSGSQSLRLLTNAALDANDAPDHDLSNPRTGWRYAVEYELLDNQRNLVSKSTYNFRSQIRQLLDVENNELIYPIFFGKNSLVASQTRVMQLGLTQSSVAPAILRVRVASSDPEIKDVVARVLTRIEREEFDRRSTWVRLPQSKRERISKHCVYHHDLLTINERNNLMRWQWMTAPTLTKSESQHLFFIGDVDDREVRDEQIPAGLYADTAWRGTIAVPEGPGRVRLDYQLLDSLQSSAQDINVSWYGADVSNRYETTVGISQVMSSSWLDVDGGLIEIRPSQRVVVRAFWQPATAADSEFTEITPESNYVRTFLSDTRPIEYAISHIDDQITPLRLSIRYPYAPLFSNLGEQIGISTTSGHAVDSSDLTWEFVNDDGDVLQSGRVAIEPIKSVYDRFTVAGKQEPVSDPHDFFFAVPPTASRVRVKSDDTRLLVTGYVRPANMSRVTQVPEDFHAFNRNLSTRRTWFGLNPIGHDDMIQQNRSFIIQSQSRPPEPNEEVLAGRYVWQRFMPKGNWIGRQLLVPQSADPNLGDLQLREATSSEASVRESAISSTFFELIAGVESDYREFDSLSGQLFPARIAFVSDEGPGQVSIFIDGKMAKQTRIASARGQFDLSDLEFAASGTIRIDSDRPARFFISGKEIQGGAKFIKRTAQRLKDGQLEFDFEKRTAEVELLTLQLYRSHSEHDRCKLRVNIVGPLESSSNVGFAGVKRDWTTRQRVYDLRPQADAASLLMGHADKVDTGHRCFVRLGEDLPPGTYRISVARDDDVDDGYVLLYQVVHGEQPTRFFQVGTSQGDSDGN